MTSYFSLGGFYDTFSTLPHTAVLMKKQLYHTTYKMYLAAVTLWTLHLLCMVISWCSYGSTGWEKSSLEVFGECAWPVIC